MSLIGRMILVVLVAVAALFAVRAGAQPAEPVRPVLIVEVDGVIGPPSAHHIENALEEARERGAEAIIIQLNTPGGLETSMRDIIEDILASPVPVIGYVAPSGGRAASAGTYIMYATHVAAMAPGTNIGAATPVNLGGGEEPAPEGDEKAPDDEKTKAPAPDTAMERKAVNDAAAFIRSLAAMRGRNAAWAEEAVRDGVALSAAEALEQNVVEIVATDVADLIDQIDGRVIAFGGADRTLTLAGRPLERIEASWMNDILNVLANPNVAFLLMMIGFYGLIYEFLNPGFVLPGVMGAICLVLGLYALNQLPLDYAGLALMLLGIAFIVVEIFTTSFGVLGIGGVIAFVIGAGMLIDTDIPEYRLDWRVIIGVGALTAGFVAIAGGFAVKSMRKKPATGYEGLVGQSAQVLDWAGGQGHVWAEGERWSADGPADLETGTNVTIESVKALRVRVKPEAAQKGTP